ncbi:MAG: hypothetical protein PHF14_09265 [Verrucomicrobiota bacterium]|nr:hypothetical protein [Verrucomicrobiota bacterium]
MARSNFTAEWCQHHNNTVALPGFVCPNPITRPFDTETDSDPDPDFASPLTSSDPDGEGSRRDRRGRRGVLGGGKGTHIGAVFNNCLGLRNGIL